MKTGLKPLLWSFIAFLLIMLLVVPGFNIIALLLMAVPYSVLYTLLNRKAFAVHVFVVWLASALLIGPSFVLFMGLFFIIPGIILGNYYKKGVPSTKIIPYISAIFLAELMLMLLVFEVTLGISLLGEIRDTIMTFYQEAASQGVLPSIWTPEAIQTLIDTMLNMIPMVFMITAFMFAVISHTIARRLATYYGTPVTPFPEAKDWRLPRALVTLYLIAYILQLIMVQGDSFMHMAILNLVPLLGYVFSIQAIGLFFFIGDRKGWPKVIPLLIAIPIILFPPLSLIGVIDTAFPIRKSFQKH